MRSAGAWLFAACLAGGTLTGSAQQKARDDLMYPVNPPRTASQSAAGLESSSKPPPLSLARQHLRIEGETMKVAVDGRRLLLVVRAAGKDVPVAKDVGVVACFYERRADGQVHPMGCTGDPHWTSDPVDWKDGAETLEVRSTTPKEGGQFFGCNVGLYYRGQLDEAWSSSPDLLEQFPLPPTMPETAARCPAGTNLEDCFARAVKQIEFAEKAPDRNEGLNTLRSAIDTLHHLQEKGWEPQRVAEQLKKAEAAVKVLEAR